MMLLIISFLAGMVLGLRFRVLVLLPAIALAIIATTGAGIAQGDQFWSIVLLAVGMTIALQIGYLIGTGIQSFIAASQASRAFPASVPAPAAVRRPVDRPTHRPAH